MGAVAYTVTQDIYTGTQFKFRKNNSWDVNLGYNAEFGDKAYYLTAGSNDLAPGGPNMMVPTSGTWMFVLIPEGNFLAAELLKEFDDPVDPDPDPDPEEPTGDVWSIIGSMNGDGWGIDHDLTTYKAEDGSLWYYIEIKLAEDDEFKFRKDHDWKVNFGPDYPSGTSFTFEDHVLIWSDESTYDVPEIPLRQDGANFRVPVSGLWSLELYPDDAVVLAYRVQE